MMTDRDRRLIAAFYIMLGRSQESRKRKDFIKSRKQCEAAMRIQKRLIITTQK
jgi:hypothetical protein